jgi:hypothetical protein
MVFPSHYPTSRWCGQKGWGLQRDHRVGPMKYHTTVSCQTKNQYDDRLQLTGKIVDMCSRGRRENRQRSILLVTNSTCDVL